jgi:serine/threonine protein kinase
MALFSSARLIASMTLEPKTKLAHYEIQSPIGAGGMGEVYLARDLESPQGRLSKSRL